MRFLQEPVTDQTLCIFFEKFNIRYWTDDVQTRSINVNTKVKASIELPSPTIAVPYIRDIRPIYYSAEADSANPAKILNNFPKYSSQVLLIIFLLL